MKDDVVFPLPELVLMEMYNGDFTLFLEAVYQYFKKDFIDSKPTFRGVRLGLKKIPFHQGKEATFWHFTSEGENENNRTPDMRRMERIRWSRPMIDNSEHSYLKVWKNTRGREQRILIWHDKEEYLVVLAERKDYILPWTAYLVKEENRKRKLLKECSDYLKSQNRPVEH